MSRFKPERGVVALERSIQELKAAEKQWLKFSLNMPLFLFLNCSNRKLTFLCDTTSVFLRAGRHACSIKLYCAEEAKESTKPLNSHSQRSPLMILLPHLAYH